MTCEEFKAQVAAYALGALTPEERAVMDDHLQAARHEGCAEALAQALETAQAVARSAPPARVPAELWPKIARQAGIKSTAELAKQWVPWLAVAAALLLVLDFGFEHRALVDQRTELASTVTRLQADLEKTRDTAKQAQAAEQVARDACAHEVAELRQDRVLQRELVALMEQPTTRVVALGPVGDKHLTASAVVNVAQHRGFVIAGALPRQPGRDYELWVIHGKGAPEPAGLLHDNGNGMLVGALDTRVLAVPPDALALSIEPEGGRPTPTEVVALAKLKG